MATADPDILNRLRKEILPLQGFKPSAMSGNGIPGFEAIEAAFPGNRFPTGAVHEFMCTNNPAFAATSGFVCGLLSSLMAQDRAGVWISSSQQLFPPAVAQFGIDPERLIMIETPREKELLWIMEEALKCEGLGAVVCEVSTLSFIASRRLQLAVEESGVTGMLIRSAEKNNITSALARWRISALPGIAPHNLPGLGYPRWNVILEKVRNGKPSAWQIEWNGKQFAEIVNTVPQEVSRFIKKTG